MAYNRATGASVELTKGFDLQVDEVVLSPDGNTIYFTAGDRGKSPIFRIPFAGGVPQKVVPNVFATALRITPDGKALVFSSSSMASPAEIYTSNADGTGLTALTSVNSQLMSSANLKTAEEIEWTGALGKKIHGFIVKPTNFDAEQEVSAGGVDSWWTTKRVERQLGLSLEPASVCECRLRRVCAEPARLDWLRATVCE